MGCGDDSDDTGGSGTGGGGTGGKAGAGGKSGSGGSAGKAGASGGSADPAACVKQTGDLMKGQSGGLSAACISCICDQNAKAVVACDGAASCWPLISCVADKCTGNADQIACAGDMCKDYFAGGAATATALGPILQGNACAAKCVPAEGDAGVDAGS